MFLGLFPPCLGRGGGTFRSPGCCPGAQNGFGGFVVEKGTVISIVASFVRDRETEYPRHVRGIQTLWVRGPWWVGGRFSRDSVVWEWRRS